MNNLCLLRKEKRLSTRDMQQYTGISYTTINYLEKEDRPFREKHINILTSFFNVTTDYLLGKSDKGYIVHTEYGSKDLVLSYSEYQNLKPNITTTIIDRKISLALPLNDETITSNRYTIYRELKGSIEDYETTEMLTKKVNDLLETMNNDQIKKTITFIETYIK